MDEVTAEEQVTVAAQVFAQTPFGLLPAEIRNRIYELAITHQGSQSLRTGFQRPGDCIDIAKVDEFNQLTCTCRQLRQETHAMFYATNLFEVHIAADTDVVQEYEFLESKITVLNLGVLFLTLGPATVASIPCLLISKNVCNTDRHMHYIEVHSSSKYDFALPELEMKLQDLITYPGLWNLGNLVQEAYRMVELQLLDNERNEKSDKAWHGYSGGAKRVKVMRAKGEGKNEDEDTKAGGSEHAGGDSGIAKDECMNPS
ncbi:hypothetical protein LTR56_001592 [Elasticomyces elasticus]|nr:hypothetical protein LTR56_001592 [Elasticomyces elasticus]KAK3667356.1 hypothetical protein LTR22_001872 [Elasticomyces elasticus]KAK4932564.1 hypothetical protein LTR49_000988 [Elasticomyces elasticus]KAK5769586.1 hypothetical protein LTS12_000036 [Elasticomyces elasticus]